MKKYEYVRANRGESMIDYIKRIGDIQKSVPQGEVVYGQFDVADPTVRPLKLPVFFDGTDLPAFNPGVKYAIVNAPSGTKVDFLQKMADSLKDGENVYTVFNSPSTIVTSDELRAICKAQDPVTRRKSLEILLSKKNQSQMELRDMHTHRCFVSAASLYEIDA